MADCKFCKDFKAEQENITIAEIQVGSAGYFGYICPLMYCPACGERVRKVKCSSCVHKDKFIVCRYGKSCTKWEGEYENN